MKTKVPSKIAFAVGTIHDSNNSGKFKVVDYYNPKKVTIEFIDTGYQTTRPAGILKLGCVKDKLAPSTYGVGILGVGNHSAGGDNAHAYDKWSDMLARCYYEKSGMLYIGDKVHVCEEWLNYQTFCDWLSANGGTTKETRLKRAKGATVFSPDTCKIVNKER